MTPVRSFPIHLQPLPGEALDSWIEAFAHRMHACLGDLLVGLGLAPDENRTREQLDGAPEWTVLLRPNEAAGITAATGIPQPEVEAMTLAHYDGIVLRLDRPNRRVSRHHLWGRATGSRYCPDCLAASGGRWPLLWRLGWTFACPAHQRLLADTCPSCGRPPRQRPHPALIIPQPGRCAHPAAGGVGLGARRCAGDLGRADTAGLPLGHPALTAQQILLEVIGSGAAAFGVYASDPQPARAALADVRALANRILTYATADDLAAIVPADLLASYRHASAHRQQRQHRPGFMAPEDAAMAAVGVTAAITVLGAADVPAAGAALRWLVQGSRHRGVTVSPTAIRSWGHGTSPVLTAIQLSALDPLLNPSDRLRYRSGTSTPRGPSPGASTCQRRTRHTPALLWPAWALRLALPHCHQQHLRPALSCALLLVGTRLRLSDAASQLGVVTDDRRVSRILQLLDADPHGAHILAGITRAADYLDAHNSPIDYHRRRKLDYDDLLPDDTWFRLCEQTSTPTGTRKAAIARSVLFQRISGLPADRAPCAIDDADFRAGAASFPARLTPELATGLDDAARAFLHHHHIRDEPVSWHPPLTLLSGLELPGPDPDSIDITEVHRSIRRGRATLQATAEQLGTTIDAVRYLLEENPAPKSPPVKRRVLASARAALPKHELAELYLGQRLSLREIGRRVGASRQTITRLARDYDISLQKGPHPRTVIDRAWLFEQYITHRRTLNDLARETGMSTANMNRWAHNHNIPLRARGEASHQRSPHAEDAGAPAILRPALKEIRGWQRLQQFAAAARYPTISAAADALGLHQSTLTMQIARLERDLGDQLLVRAERGHPMSLTAFGLEITRAIGLAARRF
jgi:hypothetical protein